MAGRTDGLIKNYRAGAAGVAPFTIVKPGASDVEAVPAAGTGDAAIGVSGELAAAAGERCDVHMSDIADVRLGGPVTRGDLLTSDAQGRAIAAAPGAGAKVRMIGLALVSGVLGDIAPVRILPGQITG